RLSRRDGECDRVERGSVGTPHGSRAMTTTAPPAVQPADHRRADAAQPATRSPRRTPLRPHWTTAISVLAVTTSAWALNPLLEPGRWARLAFAACGVLAGGTAWWRVRARNALVPTLSGIALLGYGLAGAYLSPPGELDLLPDGETLDRLGFVAESLSAAVLEGVAPIPVTSALELAVVAGICGVYLLVELACFGLRAPAWAGLPLLGLWIP